MTNDGSTPQSEAGPVPSRRPRLLASLLLFALAWVAYAGTLSNDFVAFDDPNYITANEAVQQGLGLDGLRYAFSPEQAANWHPLT